MCSNNNKFELFYSFGQIQQSQNVGKILLILGPRLNSLGAREKSLLGSKKSRNRHRSPQPVILLRNYTTTHASRPSVVICNFIKDFNIICYLYMLLKFMIKIKAIIQNCFKDIHNILHFETFRILN